MQTFSMGCTSVRVSTEETACKDCAQHITVDAGLYLFIFLIYVYFIFRKKELRYLSEISQCQKGVFQSQNLELKIDIPNSKLAYKA